MKKIFKYSITPANMSIQLPIGYSIRSCSEDLTHEDGKGICVWIEVDTSELQADTLNLVAYATGAELEKSSDEDHEFITTVHMRNGLVFHIFKLLDVEPSTEVVIVKPVGAIGDVLSNKASHSCGYAGVNASYRCGGCGLELYGADVASIPAGDNYANGEFAPCTDCGILNSIDRDDGYE